MAESPTLNPAEQAALIAQLQSETAALREELDETNQGVLALYAELDTQAEELKQASDLKSRFLSYMSHEFRTPLGSILSINSLLADELDGPLSPEQHKQVAFVSSAARELSDMVDDLLDLAKIEAGRITISPAWFDMFDLFSALRGMFRPIVDASAVDLIFEEPVGLPRLYTDDKKLAQILRNFISNSLKFTTRGEVRVSARLEGSDKVRFAVSDTGIGIAPELHGALFEDFSQVDSPLQKRLRGTGLGLSLCKRFAALLGGEVGMDSTPGVGSTFFVIIPLALALENVDET
ncbi:MULTISPECIES: sensor histidine kinase KdpD [Pseudomonas]|jgi:signal transduction histidine kinase|uniref:histidine kinase n=1 Tax=Pseudomonas fluorescens R124 TaxID=743713 RepID=A0A7U9CNI1_PSEFL|nr:MULTISPECIES: ATP-binding protein [Pseudomonas]RBB99498.1 two-component sensor histidine kinase [Pseudomonas sp. MWU12-2115]RBL72589.1 two-component sensor histidine kinase [Pseudomonas sp. MWU13-2625]EJZ58648.1 Signal transduction histidine kinase [Pseudomonas fluorescens R124]MBK5343709.1 two-component sensor histidine kinase [Pseudomonas sp. TH49]MCU1774711.1 ATP-binding protein [Pseudomonas sp. 13B_3.2_Bac1]